MLATPTRRYRSRPRDPNSWHSQADHPEDRAARAALGAELRQLRQDLGLTREQVSARYAQRGFDPIESRSLYATEKATSWQIRTIQTLARMYDRCLDIEITGLAVPDDGDPLAALYATMRPTAAAAADELAREILINDLTRIRRSLNLTQLDVGDAFGISRNAICAWESCAPGVTFRTTQRITRYYGGRLAFHLRDAAPAR
ncbi:helix-turn-helix transcriptional regulator [Micromonospora lupini]|uniref:helix-turn-helix transcriptional regulator n=1 Tax=Micromonospora lupini TaxID=285679 RepID=UPI002252B94B|nr:helix-turn-helix transcriptional regulator [Micromonospora lupini]MCX5070886.1 helix-turn-helix transcriptional regulator [Micromonospora lupini]